MVIACYRAKIRTLPDHHKFNKSTLKRYDIYPKKFSIIYKTCKKNYEIDEIDKFDEIDETDIIHEFK